MNENVRVSNNLKLNRRSFFYFPPFFFFYVQYFFTILISAFRPIRLSCLVSILRLLDVDKFYI